MKTNARRPWIAAVLTLLVPGLGQLYGGEPRRALVVYLGGISLVTALLATRVPRTFVGLIVFLLVVLLFLLWVIWDAVRIARRKTDYDLRPYNRWYFYAAVVGVVGLCTPKLLALSPIRAFQIPSGSMEPAVRVGDHLYADMTYYRSAKPSRGDLVVFTDSEDPARMKIGRAIGLEGERVEIRDKGISIEGRPLTDPWGHYSQDDSLVSGNPQLRLRDNFGPLKIPAETVFLLGDNRDNSYDSRFFGPVPHSSLRGRLLYVYWSPDRSRIGTYLK
jgi:signal peptidase I